MYRITRNGFPGVYTVGATSMDHARSLAEKFFKAVLSDFTWRKTIHIETCAGEDIPEPCSEEVDHMLSANDKH